MKSFYCCQKELSRYHTGKCRVNNGWSIAVNLWITGMKPVTHNPTATAEAEKPLPEIGLFCIRVYSDSPDIIKPYCISIGLKRPHFIGLIQPL